MRKHGRVDSNQAEIVAALRAVGASVQTLANVGNGCPDLLVGFRGVNRLLEVKRPGGKLTEPELAWGVAWRGRAEIVESVDDALREIGAA